MPLLTVSRTSETDVRHRFILVKLDGEQFGDLAYGQSVTREIPSGDHKLNLTNTWAWKTVAFTAGEGEHVRFQLINRPGKFTWWMIAMLGAGPIYLTVTRE